MKHLFSTWDEFSSACRQAEQVLVLADYDGTLTPIAPRPQDAILAESMRNRMILLAGAPGFSLGVISGRELTEIQSLVAIGGIYYGGNHGLEMDGPGFSYINSEAQLSIPVIREMAGKLEDSLKGINGVVFQDKELSLSIHYRQVDTAQQERVSEIVRQVTESSIIRGEIRIFQGKKVWEIRPPVDWDKGWAVDTIRREVMAVLKVSSLLTIFIGDDETDEDAFRVVQPPDGWSVYVGDTKPGSNAEYYVQDPMEVEELFSRLIESG